ncbi:MAG: universal stress protein, partial [Bacteroidetes bacterium]
MKTILVPTDFSKDASNAVRYATAIAKKEKAKIILLHAFHFTYISPDVPAQFAAETIEAMKADSEHKLKLISSEIVKSKIECEYLNNEGFTLDVILKAIEKQKPDLVIMGTKGASGIKEVLIGSNTAKVIEKSL